jgi:16S rRNA (adenine1518-N6/adenine1519-N6)-dimethyltransferase
VKPRRRYGQHFLEPAWVTKLVAAIDPQPTDRVLEIGPGRGALTLPLARRVERLLAVEIDRDLATALASRDLPHVRVVSADVLDVDLDALVDQLSEPGPSPAGETPRGVRVVGNLPYYISSPIVFRLLEAARRGRLFDATLMVQKEVADRIVAGPGTKAYGALTIGVALGADAAILLSLPPGAFRPPPAVRSAVVRLVFHPPPVGITDVDLLTTLVRSAFTQRRKTLNNALASFAASAGLTSRALLAEAGVEPGRRPETLSLQEFGRLAAAVRASRRDSSAD